MGATHTGSEGQVNGDTELEDVAVKGASGTEGEDAREPTIRDLISMFQAFMGRQEAREVRWKEEATRQEHRFKADQHQLQQEVQVRTSPVPELTSTIPDPLETPEPDDYYSQAQAITPSAQIHPAIISPGQSQVSHEPRLEKLTENDVEHFLTTFEGVAAACQWPKSDWVFRLIPLLTGKAREAYVHMEDDSLDYEKLKTAILKKYDTNPETYRKRFPSLDVGGDENPKELYVRLKERYGKWIQPQGKTVQQIGEIVVDVDSPTLSALPFYGVELETQPGKSQKPRSQRRQEKFQSTAIQPSAEVTPDTPPGFQVPTNITEMKHNDPTLPNLLQKAAEREPGMEPDGKREEYFLQKGVLYRQHDQVKQLVVPQGARGIVLALGHTIPWAGHRGKHKTTARIKTGQACAQRWPSSAGVAISAKRQRLKAPLELPSNPLQSSILPLNASGWTLLVLWRKFFSRVGFPREVWTDHRALQWFERMKDTNGRIT